MNTKRVNAAAGVIARAMENGRRVPAGMAMALESAQMLMSPEVAAELARLRAQVAALDALKLPESLKADDTIAPEYRCGYVHALADMRMALLMPQPDAER